MITSLTVEQFKAFESFSVGFGQINLLVGGNNSGKTTIFHALQLFWWCLDKTAVETPTHVTLRKTQVADIPAIPNARVQDLFHAQKIRTGRGPTRMRLIVSSENVSDVAFEIYSAFANNYIVSGNDRTLTQSEYDELRSLKPLFIPGMVGVTVREDLLRPIAQERMIREGNQSQVLRNIIYEVSKKGKWQGYLDLVRPIFEVNDVKIPFDPEKDEWLTVEYEEGGNYFDVVSAGSGFLQLINLLGFIFLHEPKVALIDEPDSHMHDDLQRLTFDVIRSLA
ncbi:MAG TPA: AAA family ATPase, partial [Candidatus Paceibacterota bacterium]|nr:AAA family ATPase [Candidatus Paceibacterota bacterium]